MKRSVLKSTGLATLFVASCLASAVSTAYNGEPRVSITQGIDATNAIVLANDATFLNLERNLDPVNQPTNPLVTLNPFGTAPLSAYYGFWNSNLVDKVEISVTSKNSQNPVKLGYTFIPSAGPNLAPVSGLEADTENIVNVIITWLNGTVEGYSFEIKTAPLPVTDADTVDGKYVVNGTPVFTTKYSDSDFSKRSEGIYFTSFFGRGHYGLDNNGDLRWFLTRDVIPSFNFAVLPNGRYISDGNIYAENSATTPDDYKVMYEWDIMGRVYTVYDIDYKAHHSSTLVSGDNNKLIYASEDSQPGDGSEVTREDGVSIIDLKTGEEVNYYDMSLVLDPNREHPLTNSDGDPRNDWAHLNKTYFDNDSGLIISSVRHQNVVFGIKPNDLTNTDPDIKFIAGSHFNWGQKWQAYLLQPVDSSGNNIYDLSTSEGQKLADKEFWTWGQHGVQGLPTTDSNIINYAVFDNGNYRSYGELQYGEDGNSEMLVPADNWSSYVEYSVNISNMTIQKITEYGKEEFGAYYYSSLVGNVEKDQDNGNLLINFGGAILDENGLPTTIGVNSDINDPNAGSYAKGHPSIVEVKQEADGSYTKLFELEVTSGRAKSPEDGANGAYRYDLTQFFVIKKPLYE